MPWYYSDGIQQLGPVSDEEFARMTASGAIGPATLVWSPGMDQWRRYGELAPPSAAAPPPPPPPPPPASTAAPLSAVQSPGGAPAGPSHPAAPSPSAPAAGRCTECGAYFSPEFLTAYQDRRICPGCKPGFFRRMREDLAAAAGMDYAGFWIRFCAKFADQVLLGVAHNLLGLTVTPGMLLGDDGTYQIEALRAFARLMAISFAISAAYFIGFNGAAGATPGKMIFGLRIVNAAGAPIGFARAAGRHFAEILSGLTLGIGYIMAGLDEEKRSLHDRIAGTRVIRRRS